MVLAMALSGDTLPQVSQGGNISGNFHVVTSDGCGSVSAVLDPTATGKFSEGTKLTTVQDVPGTNGNCPRSITKKSFVRDILERSGVITRRATNVNMDFPVTFTLPSNVACSGTVGNVNGVCFVKMANTNPAGPFGGVVPIQVGNNSTTPPPAAAPPATGAGTGAGTGATNRRRAREFSA
ncbi:hypothetical protein N0V82_004740 [Gnomoniopsis sp. IMI 355080]|nr:hypothetical protein N0V82_004740 [Gnomoniopsis sp. IMI 355080]